MNCPALPPPTAADIHAAAQRLQGVAHRTPVLRSGMADKLLGAQVFFKCENLQRTGSFKFRGAYNALAQFSPQQRERGVLTFSAGNHAQAIALAARLRRLNVPTLVIDGRPQYEAAALALVLAERHPDDRLAPLPDDTRRADYLQWMFNLANMVQPLFRQWWYPGEPAGEANADVLRAHCAPRIEAEWQRIDDHLAAHGPYLLGDEPSVADFYLTMLMRWSRNMPKPATEWPQLAALAQRMKARPSFKLLYEREGLSEWA